MAERVGNPVPEEIRDQLEGGEDVLVFELVTRPKAAHVGDDGTWAARFAGAIWTDDQHEVLLTRQRLAVVTTGRRDKAHDIAISVPLDELVAVEAAGAGLDAGASVSDSVTAPILTPSWVSYCHARPDGSSRPTRRPDPSDDDSGVSAPFGSELSGR